jgi:hypothetical protein
MSPIKEIAIRMIQDIPDDKIIYILHIFRGINGLYKNTTTTAENRREAFNHIQQFRGKMPLNLDYGEELAKSRVERYASIG